MTNRRLYRTIAVAALVGLGLSAIVSDADANAGDVSTLAGAGTLGAQDGVGSSATFFGPSGVVVDSFGNVFVADQGNNEIRKVTPGGVVSTFAGSTVPGSADGQGIAASFNGPFALAIDPADTLYVSDRAGFLIRKITPAGLVSTFAGSGAAASVDGLGVAASFVGPNGIALDSSGNVFVADTDNQGNSAIRKITPGGLVSTFAGSGTAGYADLQGTAAMFHNADEIVIDSGNNLFVTDTLNYRIRKITPTGLVSTFAGSGVSKHTNGTGVAAEFKFPQALAIDAAGNLYVGDRFAYVVRKITTSGVVTDIAGAGVTGNIDGIPSMARFQDLIGATVDTAGNLYIADLGNNSIRKIESAAIACSPVVVCASPTSTTTSSTSPGGCVTGATICTTTTITSTTSTTIPALLACPTATSYDVTGVPTCPAATIPPTVIPSTTPPDTKGPTPTTTATTTTVAATVTINPPSVAIPAGTPPAPIPAPATVGVTPAFTGRNVLSLVSVALALLAAGLGLMSLARQRATAR